jgi:hypothetical protein
MDYDLLLIPAISTKTKRTFSDAKHTISPTRTYLGADIIKAEEFLYTWYGRYLR